VVMMDGQVVQAGTPVELFERPRHTFVGHFIGSPGMNLLPCEIDAAGVARVGGHAVPTAVADARSARGKATQVGVRPEFIRFAEAGLPVTIDRVADVGRFRIVDARHGEHTIKVLAGEGIVLPSGAAHLALDPQRTQVYADGWIVE
jgi:glycerol transport system ATP-binding protein